MVIESDSLNFLHLLIFVIGYIYFALAWQTIAKKMKHDRPWLSWIPIANLAMILQLGNFSWVWIFLLLAPFISLIIGVILIVVSPIVFGLLAIYLIATSFLVIVFIVILYISLWRVFEKRNYPGWLIFLYLIPGLISILINENSILYWILYILGLIISALITGLVAWRDRVR